MHEQLKAIHESREEVNLKSQFQICYDDINHQYLISLNGSLTRIPSTMINKLTHSLSNAFNSKAALCLIIWKWTDHGSPWVSMHNPCKELEKKGHEWTIQIRYKVETHQWWYFAVLFSVKTQIDHFKKLIDDYDKHIY